MIFSNNKSVNVLRGTCFCLLLAVPFFFLLKVEERIDIIQFYIFSAIALMVLAYIYAKASYFKYDSSGQKLRLQNKKALYRFYLKRKNVDIEFDKVRLKRYKITNYLIYKSLTLYVSGSKNKETLEKISFDITFLTPKKTKMLKMSLDNALNSNTATV